jgi:hypothetical protein
MSDVFLSQSEGDLLLAMEKYSSMSEPVDLPALGGTLSIRFVSTNNREEFILNYTRHSINLSKRNHHLRCKKAIGLVRLDLDGPPHHNPDGQEVGSRHLHLYREGFGLKWAFDVPIEVFKNLDSAYETLYDFMKYCNVVQMPQITMGLFA